ncbi:thermonuclease family protein [Blastochloris sulfoviridis]|uniref:Thermonuclease family protein n=1 Tax=Blastochloris sulfoviridis TaxID=50712 RepID=A0A5M6HVE0_9HYPH|nr:thermonuclease family protein [Blastochloris sulfoviridis]KAA5599873.1 thermonuclease family protein [Blastochloris sulfoviridis]
MALRFTRRWPLPLDIAGALVLALGLAWLGTQGRAPIWSGEQEVSGVARVVDGDSLRIGNAEIRLYGIDAPERSQTCERDGRSWPCGEAARRRLADLAEYRLVRCKVRDTDRYRRAVSECEAGGADLARQMALDGLAVAESGYFVEEVRARVNGRGLWAGQFVRPSEWRRAHPHRPH